MKFWTIQPRSVWEQMERGEAVRVDPDHPKYGGKRPWQYEWLAAALRRNCSGFDGGWPWWLSCAEPDIDPLRTARLPGGSEQACIELELPVNRCATFPLWMWETIYTGHYLASSRSELDDWHRELHAALSERELWPLPEPWQHRLEASWERLFAPGFRPRFWYRDEQRIEENPVLGDLMAKASDEVVGLVQELRSSDSVSVALFVTAD